MPLTPADVEGMVQAFAANGRSALIGTMSSPTGRRAPRTSARRRRGQPVDITGRATGARCGIGRAVALEQAGRGYDETMFDRTGRSLPAAAGSPEP